MSRTINPKKLKQGIKESGKKQKYIALKANLTEHLLSMIVRGKAECPLAAYLKICEELGVPLGTYLNDEEKASNQ